MARTPAPEAVRREQILRAAFEVAAEEGLGGVTLRAVAAEAKLSHALVLVYFGRKDRLVEELLAWMLANSPVLRIPEAIARLPGAMERLCALLQHEMAREPRHTRLFLEYWAMGARHPALRARIGAELERYRVAFRGIVEELIRADPPAFVGITADALSAVAVSSIHGCAVQANNDPDRFDGDEYIAAVCGIIALAGRPG
jgi:TetR/AcrR family transcriptional regulator, transcriptional repressor of bet genes